MDSSIDIGDLAAVVTVAGIAVYVVGLIGLAIAISLHFNHHLSTAWYVVALVPRTVVAGQGVKIWLEYPLFFAALLILLSASAARLTSSREVTLSIVERLTPYLLLVFLVLILARYVRLIRRMKPQNADKNPESVERRNADKNPESVEQFIVGRHFIVAVVIALVGGVIMYVGASSVVRVVIHSTGSILSTPVQNVLLGVMIFIIGGFLVGMPAAATIDHPLPLMEAERRDQEVETADASDVSTCLKGNLIAHTDGYWHLFKEETGELMSVPDSQIIDVSIKTPDRQSMWNVMRTSISKWRRK